MIASVLKIALRALARNKARSILTMLGIVIGVAAVIAMVSLGQGAQEQVQQQIANMGTNMLIVSAGSQNTGGLRGGAGSTTTFTPEDVQAILREAPDVRAQATTLRARAAMLRIERRRLTAGGALPFSFAVHFADVRQSMRNGGGPACLRLRVHLADAQRRAALPGVFFDDSLHQKLTQWIHRHYREHLRPADLADPRLIDEGRVALEELTRILGLGPIYPFMR